MKIQNEMFNEDNSGGMDFSLDDEEISGAYNHKNTHKGEVEKFGESLVHGNNISAKERQKGKNSKPYRDDKSQELLSEIRDQYDEWRQNNMSLKGPFIEEEEIDSDIIEKRVDFLNEYKDFIDQQVYAEAFDSRSRLHSTVIEEFFVYLFGDLVAEFSNKAHVGQSRAFKDIFFDPPNYDEMVESPHANIEQKEHDFAIGVDIGTIMFVGEYEEDKIETHNLNIPAVVIECKTYVDKTMLEGMSTAAEELVAKNPNAIYIAAAEWIKLTSEYNPRKFKLDQVYILRRQRNTDQKFRFEDSYKKNPIYSDVVEDLYNKVRNHVTGNWEGGAEYAVETGKLMPE